MSVGDSWWERWEWRFGKRRKIMLGLLGITGIASLVINALREFSYDTSALMYIAVPYGVALLITFLRPYGRYASPWSKYFSHLVSTLVVFLASSVILFEGFICVLFFLPIYILCASAVFLITYWGVSENSNARASATVLAVVFLLLSMEGVTGATTFDRLNAATASTVAPMSSAALLTNLATPFSLAASDDWMLGVFPMPHRIEAGSLKPGDVHRIHTRYHRWFVTNTHEGEIHLRIDSVTPDRVTTSVVHDSSYVSSYVRLIGTEIRLAPIDSASTRITLTVHYERLLDPTWYFQPMQQYAMKTMASHLIDEVMIREQ